MGRDYVDRALEDTVKPVFIEPIANKENGDCCLACLVMWTGRSYQDVVAAAPPKAYYKGMTNTAVVETAAKLGTSFVRRRKFDIYEDDGILMLLPEPKKKGRSDHAVLLLNGTVLDPFNNRLWLDVEVYMKTEGYRPGELLTTGKEMS